MKTLTNARPRVGSHLPESSAIQTTLYDLTAAIADEVRPNEEALVTTVVAELLRSYRARFIGKRMSHRAWCERANYLSGVTA
jgi:hypothetical protein